MSIIPEISYREVIYLLTGALDVFVIIAFTLKIYRHPVLKQLYNIFILCVVISVFSYVMRIVLQVPRIDMPAHYLLMVLFLAWFVKIRLHHAAFMVGAGYGAFLFIQMLVYHLFLGAGLVNPTVLSANMGNDLFLLQISTQIVVGFITYYIHLFAYGFTFIDVRTPFDNCEPIDIPMVFIIFMSCITISVTLVLWYNHRPLSVIVLTAVSYGASYYLSKRRGYDAIRAAVEAYRQRNKTK